MCDELRCTKCYWDLTIYPLTADGLRQEQENRLEWARDIWRQLQHLKDVDEYQALIESNDDLQERLELEINKQDKFKDEFKAKIKELENKIDYFLSEPDRLALRRDQLSSGYDYRNSDPDYKTDRTFTADLPFKIAEAIKNNLSKSERGNNRNVWLNKVIIDAAIKEGWLDE
jgi:predicted nuclease with TOPRIM domain